MFFTRRLAVLAFAALLSAPAWTAARAADRVDIPGTIVSIEPPDGFTVSKDFAGLVNLNTGASILINEFPPEAHAEIAALLGDLAKAKEQFASRGVTIEEVETLDTQSGKVPVASGEQKTDGVTFDKWITVYRGKKTVMITIQSPKSAEIEDDDVNEALSSVKLKDE